MIKIIDNKKQNSKRWSAEINTKLKSSGTDGSFDIDVSIVSYGNDQKKALSGLRMTIEDLVNDSKKLLSQISKELDSEQLNTLL
jgi:hypothetical protein